MMEQKDDHLKTQRHEKKVLLFGGTSEGRAAAERLLSDRIPCVVCVATEYGGQVMRPHPLLTVHTGRMDRFAMAALMQREHFACVIDATHPHALMVSEELQAACAQTGLPCLRLKRETDPRQSMEDSGEEQADIIRVGSISEAAACLAGRKGSVLVTTGSKDLERFARELGDVSRIFARVLPSQESLAVCLKAGLTGRQIFAMQGPFDMQMNCALIRHTGAQWLLTKETGQAGGYPEKIGAARQCGAGVVSIRVREEDNAAEGFDLEEVLARAKNFFGGAEADTDTAEPDGRPDSVRRESTESSGGRNEKSLPDTGRRLALVGIGVGAACARTREAEEAIADAQLLFGALSVLKILAAEPAETKIRILLPAEAMEADRVFTTENEKTALPAYDSRLILRFLREHPEIRRAAVVCSGDSGFYSGASLMMDALRNGGDSIFDGSVRVIPGISSVSWFASRAGIPWQDWKILSSHGRECNVVGQVRRHSKCFLLLSGAEDLRQTGNKLADAQKKGLLGDLRLICGYELSRPGEEIRTCTAQELGTISREGLYVLYIEHQRAGSLPVLPGLPDSAFVRGRAPMTSSEIRALSLCRLGLTEEAVVWDVGAGTGSVSVEAALTCPSGQVYSIEYKADALALLEENRARYCLDNMEIIAGRAPEALDSLPAPTHVFIGGSGGEIREILKIAAGKNPRARVVVNCITAETLTALQAAVMPGGRDEDLKQQIPVTGLQAVQVGVQRAEKLGNYHYLKAQNPVFIISFKMNPDMNSENES